METSSSGSRRRSRSCTLTPRRGGGGRLRHIRRLIQLHSPSVKYVRDAFTRLENLAEFYAAEADIAGRRAADRARCLPREIAEGRRTSARSVRARFTARGPGGSRGARGERGRLSFSTVRSYLATLGRERGVPFAELAKGVGRRIDGSGAGVSPRRCDRGAASGPRVADLMARQEEEPGLLEAGAPPLACAASGRKTVEERTPTVRVVWWETKEVQMRVSEAPMRSVLTPAPFQAIDPVPEQRRRRAPVRGGGACSDPSLLPAGHRPLQQHLTRLGGTWEQVASLARHLTRSTTRLYLRGAESPGHRADPGATRR